MSLCTLEETLLRIKAAEPRSCLAVFASGKAGLFNVVFDSCVKTRYDIRRGYGQLIGVYHKYTPILTVKRELGGV